MFRILFPFLLLAFMAPTRPMPTVPVKAIPPQAIPPPQNTPENEIHEMSIHQYINQDGKSITQVHESILPGTEGVVNPGINLVPHPNRKDSKPDGFRRKPFIGSPISDNIITHSPNEKEGNSNKTLQTIKPTTGDDDRFQTHVVETNTTNTKIGVRATTGEPVGLVVQRFTTPEIKRSKNDRPDIPDFTSDEPESLIINKVTPLYRKAIGEAAKNSDILKNYYKLEERHKKESLEENPRFDYLHLHEAHGGVVAEKNIERDYLHLSEARADKHDVYFTEKTSADDIHVGQSDDVKGSRKTHKDEEVVTPQFEHQIFNADIINNNNNTVAQNAFPNKYQSTSVAERSDVHDPPKIHATKETDENINHHEIPFEEPKQNIQSISDHAKFQFNKTVESINTAKENAADVMAENATKQEINQQQQVEEKADQIYAGVKAGIKNLPNMPQEKDRADNTISTINSQIQQKMQQAKVNNFWEDKLSNQKDAYSVWRKKALINFHKRNPNKPLPKNTVSLSKNSLCPGFCKLFCDPWCAKIGCCNTTPEQENILKKIKNVDATHVGRKGNYILLHRNALTKPFEFVANLETT